MGLRFLLICILSFAFCFSNLFGFEKVFDDFKENEIQSLHSYGLLSYGFHSNTFHLRYCFLKYNLSFKNYSFIDEDVAFFFTLKGYKDTHIPETNYSEILSNLELYDYGINIWLGHFFLSLRGASTYIQNLDSLLLFPPYNFNLSSEFDTSGFYQQIFLSSPGIRVGIDTGSFTLAYSQGDYRHLIPSGFIGKLGFETFYLRSVFLFSHKDPVVFKPEDFNWLFQISVRKDFILSEFEFSFLSDLTSYSDEKIILRIEEGLSYKGFTLALREIYLSSATAFLLEISIKKNFSGIFDLGLQAGSDGRYYFGVGINF